MSVVSVRDLHVLAVYVTDLTVSETFYHDILGFERIQEMKPGILMKSGQTLLYLEPGRTTARSAVESISAFSPCFDVGSVRAAWDALQAAGVTVTLAYQEYGPEFAFFRIADPDGNQIEFAGTP